MVMKVINKIFFILIFLFFILSCVSYETPEVIVPDGMKIPQELLNNEKLIELHDKAFDAGRKTIIYDDGETYLVQDKRLGYKKYAESVSTIKEKTKVNYSEKYIELHDRAFDDGRKTFVYDDGKRYDVGNKRIGTKVYPKYKTYTKKKTVQSTKTTTQSTTKATINCLMDTRFPIYIGGC